MAFKLTTPDPTIARRSDGRFAKVIAPTPEQYAADMGGKTNDQQQRATMTPDTDVAPGAPENVGTARNPVPVYRPGMPWPELVNPPPSFRLKR